MRIPHRTAATTRISADLIFAMRLTEQGRCSACSQIEEQSSAGFLSRRASEAKPSSPRNQTPISISSCPQASQEGDLVLMTLVEKRSQACRFVLAKQHAHFLRSFPSAIGGDLDRLPPTQPPSGFACQIPITNSRHLNTWPKHFPYSTRNITTAKVI